MLRPMVPGPSVLVASLTSAQEREGNIFIQHERTDRWVVEQTVRDGKYSAEYIHKQLRPADCAPAGTILTRVKVACISMHTLFNLSNSALKLSKLEMKTLRERM